MFFPYFLSVLIFLPLLGSLMIFAFLRGSDPSTTQRVKKIGIWISIFTFLISLIGLFSFDKLKTGYQFAEHYQWFANLGFSFKLGVDGASLLLIVLTTLLLPLALIFTIKNIRERVRDYVALFLLLEAFTIGTFASLDLVLFYVFFEAVLIPMFLIIGIWGGSGRIYSAYKFFLYTLIGSLCMLVSLIVLVRMAGTTDLEVLSTAQIPMDYQKWLWLGFFLSFAVKMPMFPVHTWLPDAHVEAPTAGSVILAGILLKMGGYGFYRFSLPLFPEASHYFADFVMILSCIALVYTSLIAWVQKDIKKMIAYSSVAHMAYVTAGIFALNAEGLSGGLLMMIGHGISSAALFMCIGVVYERLHTRDIERFGGLARIMPKYALVTMIFTMTSIGVPATLGFAAEFSALYGVFRFNYVYATILGLGLILGAVYMLHFYRKIFFGKTGNAKFAALDDLDVHEKIGLYPLAFLAIVLGILPYLISDFFIVSVQQVLDRLKI